MSRKALFIGIDQYDNFNPLACCVADAKAMKGLLERNEDGTINFSCKVFTSADGQPINRAFLRNKINSLFAVDFDGDALFYFSGHGTASEYDGYLVTQDGSNDDFGLPMNELLALANNSRARSVLLILDCCHSGHLGNPPNVQGGTRSQTQLREGITILAASKPSQPAVEVNGHGVFTQLVLGALAGGAADVRGRISAASIYGYVEQALSNAWGQRPLYKSHADHLPQLRYCKPAVEDAYLRLLPQIFEDATTIVPMNPTFEHSLPERNDANVELFDKFKCFRNAGLLTTQHGKDLYYTALASEGVQLTLLGQFYWKLASNDII